MLLRKDFDLFYQFERFARGRWEAPSWDCSGQAVILASYPKSGNTWMRFVLANVASLCEGGESVTFSTINQYAPAIRGNRGLQGMRNIAGLPVFLKSHSAYVPSFSKYKSVIVIRDPFKATPSYRNFLSKARERDVGSIDEFCRHWRYGFNAWAQFVESWDGMATLIVKYEDLLADPSGEIHRIYSKLGYTVNADVIKKAIANSSRQNMKSVLEKDGDPHNQNGFPFVREADENKGIRNYYDDELLQKEFPFFCKIARKFGYLPPSSGKELASSNRVSEIKIAISCLGSRERYGMPAALQQQGHLDVLYTDLYVPNSLSKFRKLPGVGNGIASLLGRNHPDIPSSKVQTYSRLGLELRVQVRRARHLNEQLSLLMKYGAIFADYVGEDVVQRKLDMLIAFTGAAKETFEALQQAGSSTLRILDQVDPGLNDYLLIHDECNKFSAWGEGEEQLNVEYFDRVKDEINLADHLIVNSTYSRDMIQSWLGERSISVLPIPSSFERKQKTEINRNKRLKVLFLGTLSLRKGVHYALEAVEQMRHSGRDVSLTLAGGCRIEPRMLSKFKSSNYLGPVPSNVVQSLLDSHDVLLFPTLSEGFGIVQVEAISRGVPVIATKNCGQVIEDGISGLIIDAMSTEAIITSLSRYYHNRELLAEHSRNAYLRSEFFTIENYAVQLIKCLEGVRR
ncbi:glycosyltransferase [Ferriphaselus sp. R-1]|uniref:glycosyltransferase n=1 Tax=Ferriphaselus sp. R-1 TaxID=1485544 RepID=UPI0009E04CEB|nr:glycosyltransferase [Ferriphaselus sp. R-1]